MYEKPVLEVKDAFIGFIVNACLVAQKGRRFKVQTRKNILTTL